MSSETTYSSENYYLQDIIRITTSINYPIMLNMLLAFNSSLVTLGKILYVYKH